MLVPIITKPTTRNTIEGSATSTPGGRKAMSSHCSNVIAWLSTGQMPNIQVIIPFESKYFTHVSKIRHF